MGVTCDGVSDAVAVCIIGTPKVAPVPIKVAGANVVW